MAIIDTETGRKLCTTAEAAQEFGCSTHHIRGLAAKGILWQTMKGPRVFMYDIDEVKRVAKERRAKRAKKNLAGDRRMDSGPPDTSRRMSWNTFGITSTGSPRW